MKKYDTRQRDYLISFLNEHPDQLLSVRQIAQELCAQQISLSAVYRNLSQLEAEGLIRKSVKPGSREAYYQYVGAEDCHSHLHLSCTRCGKTFHMDAAHTAQLTRAMSELDGFDLDILKTVLYGICQNCHGT
ncbi:transcriptional regulator, Fur family [Pseudoflavonifractor capillosus ATCC 29799]|uniref:Transcriptional regulator, Fur family n=1 Tax=Pseudoflavonifractor capillosus ATCC 29799 TaxID=411467 RepID=A6NSR8_9FIRM|nr:MULTISPECIES: transcriptional repressor [Oscillospiraceae]EDN00895.1 transcriptional regulator, Fur family [Pseudoflavonifractor capillosus ATCC 29799]OUN20386.1 transcriptional repressor [Flavonifractor sp. An82]